LIGAGAVQDSAGVRGGQGLAAHLRPAQCGAAVPAARHTRLARGGSCPCIARLWGQHWQRQRGAAAGSGSSQELGAAPCLRQRELNPGAVPLRTSFQYGECVEAEKSEGWPLSLQGARRGCGARPPPSHPGRGAPCSRVCSACQGCTLTSSWGSRCCKSAATCPPALRSTGGGCLVHRQQQDTPGTAAVRWGCPHPCATLAAQQLVDQGGVADYHHADPEGTEAVDGPHRAVPAQQGAVVPAGRQGCGDVEKRHEEASMHDLDVKVCKGTHARAGRSQLAWGH
jgi:hypothetical protein